MTNMNNMWTLHPHLTKNMFISLFSYSYWKTALRIQSPKTQLIKFFSPSASSRVFFNTIKLHNFAVYEY